MKTERLICPTCKQKQEIPTKENKNRIAICQTCATVMTVSDSGIAKQMSETAIFNLPVHVMIEVIKARCNAEYQVYLRGETPVQRLGGVHA